VAYLRPRFRRRRVDRDSAAPRPIGCLWPVFWLILIIILLGLLFGGYRKGTKVGAPPAPTSGRSEFVLVGEGAQQAQRV
jgi:hypothetical protein